MAAGEGRPRKVNSASVCALCVSLNPALVRSLALEHMRPTTTTNPHPDTHTHAHWTVWVALVSYRKALLANNWAVVKGHLVPPTSHMTMW